MEWTFEGIIAAVKALGLKWVITENGQITCERGDCTVGALIRARGLMTTGDYTPNGLPGAMTRRLLGYGYGKFQQDVITRVVIANDYANDPGAIYGRAWSQTDREYLVKELVGETA